MLIRDFYFAAWVVAQGYTYRIEGNRVYLNIDRETHQKLKSEYNKKDKVYFDTVRKILRLIKANKS